MFEVILAPTDGSEHAGRAMQAAVDLAAKYRARLVVLHVLLHYASAEEIEHILEGTEINAQTRREIDMLRGVTAPIPVGGGYGHNVLSRRLADSVAAHVVERATQVAKAAGVDRGTPAVVTGSPGKRIIETARQEGADLLVMGTRGLGGLQSLLQGSVSQAVCHACHCACLTVP